MSVSEQISSASTSLNEWLSTQDWYQQLKAKWDELDPQSRGYLKISGAVLGSLFAAYMIFSFIWGVHALKHEVAEKSDILMTLEASNDELKKLQSVNTTLSPATSGPGDPWPTYFENTAAPIGIVKGSITTSDPKVGASDDMSKEVMFDIAIKKANLHQLVRLAYALESGARPVKLRGLTIDNEAELSGYLDATLSVSAFTLISQTSGK